MTEESQLQGLGTEVALGDIDAALRGLFAGEEPGGIARASLMNLAVYTEDAARPAELAAAIADLTRETACRAILILARPGGPLSARAWVQAHCRLSGRGEKTICTEQVSFLLSGADASLVRSTVFAHLDSDLPLVFWWLGELSDVFEERLTSRLDRFLFDSSGWRQPAAQFLRLASALEESGGAFVPHDLAYTRGHPLRAALARLFDEPPARRALPRLQEAEISHAPGQGTAALWLAAWMAARLGARFDAGASSRGRFGFVLGGGKKLEIACAESGKAGEEALDAVRLGFGQAGNASVAREPESGLWKLSLELEGEGAGEKLLPGSPKIRRDGDLVAEILVRAGRNRAMMEAMPILRDLLRA